MIKTLLYVAMTDVSSGAGAPGRISAILCDLRRAGVAPTLLGFGYRDSPHFESIPMEGNGIGAMLQTAYRTMELARSRAFDRIVLSSFGNPLNPTLARLLQSQGFSVAYDCHDPPIETPPLLFGRGALAKALGLSARVMDPLLRTSLTCALSVSPGVDELLRSHAWKMPIYRYYNSHSALTKTHAAASISLRSLPGWKTSSILAYVGGLQPAIRGIEEQIEAIALAREMGVDAKFAAFGWGDPSGFEALAERLGVSRHVRFEKPIAQEMVASLLSEVTAAAISTVPFALPSKLFDYLSAGVHVLCSRESSDVMAVAGNLVTPYERGASGLAAALASSSVHRNAPDQVDKWLRGISNENERSVIALAEN